MKKGLKFTKEQLEDLYWNKKLSLIQIGKKFDCEETNILYWMKKLDIKRRPVDYKAIKIPKEILEDLYWNKNWSTQQIADKYGIKYGRSILKKFKKFGIPSKTVSQANTKKFKANFIGDPAERAYFTGLRAGDFYVKWAHKSIRVQTTSTHTAQVELLRNAFENYGETKTYLSKNKARADEWFIYVDLNQSFQFLLEKPDEIPSWILENQDYFYHFLTAYMDCEGNWHFTKSHEIHSRFTFRLRTGDKLILENIKETLESLGYKIVFSLDTKKGSMGPSAPFRIDIYNLTINRKQDVTRLIKHLLPLSKHSEKIRKMNFILENKGRKWHEVSEGWDKLREEIKGELLKNH
ncbi:hypothetical protein CMO89_04530 [Candidatus Woesearchaeota archaeon]|nr:hypothetical protein [Candidatus Woesearchaeota archaeon]|tara:strand:+ start:2991 stop:4040 length:1050 start_codon:yes stop_codon:yes gene_type:complete